MLLCNYESIHLCLLKRQNEERTFAQPVHDWYSRC